MYLYGASGHASVIIDILKASNVKISGLLDDDPTLNTFMGYPVNRPTFEENPIIISIGNNIIRRKIANKCIGPFGIAIHPTSIISDNVEIESGTVVMHGAIIQTNSHIGKHCIINTGASIDHDCQISDFCHISPNATLCGNTIIDAGTWIGAGAVIIQGIHIGKNSIIGAGSIVINNIPDNTIVVGNPAKIIKRNINV